MSFVLTNKYLHLYKLPLSIQSDWVPTVVRYIVFRENIFNLYSYSFNNESNLWHKEYESGRRSQSPDSHTVDPTQSGRTLNFQEIYSVYTTNSRERRQVRTPTVHVPPVPLSVTWIWPRSHKIPEESNLRHTETCNLSLTPRGLVSLLLLSWEDKLG